MELLYKNPFFCCRICAFDLIEKVPHQFAGFVTCDNTNVKEIKSF
ncbi:hypothetical protein BVRB_5g100140 [Beta vulgaris subsp. vulgaris]|nr:hypothetical protein BVRB_5g100140 [Beta vulgaris subsp. vulgaris]